MPRTKSYLDNLPNVYHALRVELRTALREWVGAWPLARAPYVWVQRRALVLLYIPLYLGALTLMHVAHVCRGRKRANF